MKMDIIRRWTVRDGDNILELPKGSTIVDFVHHPDRTHFSVLARGPQVFDSVTKHTVLIREAGMPFRALKSLKSIGSAVVAGNGKVYHAMEKVAR